MKTNIRLLLPLFLILSLQLLHAQRLRGSIRNSIADISETFAEMPEERKNTLDQLAFTIAKSAKDGNFPKVVFVDRENLDISQLALVWFRTGLLYNGIGNLPVASAGIAAVPKPLSKLAALKPYGFRIRNVSNVRPYSVAVNYGSGQWTLFPKTPGELPGSGAKALEVLVVKGLRTDLEKQKIELLFPNIDSIARDMVYLAGSVNDIIQKKIIAQ